MQVTFAVTKAAVAARSLTLDPGFWEASLAAAS